MCRRHPASGARRPRRDGKGEGARPNLSLSLPSRISDAMTLFSWQPLPSATWLRGRLPPPCSHCHELICLHDCAESGQTPVNSLLLCKTASSLRADPSGSDGKESTCNAGDPVQSIPGSGRSPGGRHVNPLQCSCLENPTDRGAWQIHEVTKHRSQPSD